MYFMPEMKLFEQYPVAVHENYNLEKKQDFVETLDQILRQLVDKKSMINIINNCFPENFKEVSLQVLWTDMCLLPEREETIFHSHGNDDNYPKCEEEMLQFQLKLYLELLQTLCKEVFFDHDRNHRASVFHDRNNDDYGILCSLYHLWVFQSKYFFEKEMQFQFLITYYRSIKDFLKIPETVYHHKYLSPGEKELNSKPYFVLLRKKFYYNKSEFMKPHI